MDKNCTYKDLKSCLLVLIALCILVLNKLSIAEEYVVVCYDYFNDSNNLDGIIREEEIEQSEESFSQEDIVDVVTIINNGTARNRIDIAVLGDGYLETELDTYHTDVDNLMETFFAESPLDEYASFFNVHRVDIKSNESGIPIGSSGDTALKMYFAKADPADEDFRALVIDEYLTRSATNIALGVNFWQQILALGNTGKSGGRSNLKDISTVCGHEQYGRTDQIALHEFGHSFAKLHDEYWSNSLTYTGGEPGYANVSIYDYDSMKTESRKWYRWLDAETVPTAYGPIDTYVGGYYYAYGVYRPTKWSKMRELYADSYYTMPIPFLQVNTEQIILKIYEEVDQVDNATPEGTYTMGTKFFVEPLKPATHSLDIQWYLDGDEIEGATSTEFDSSTLGLTPGTALATGYKVYNNVVSVARPANDYYRIGTVTYFCNIL